MQVHIVGGGIIGLSAAWYLQEAGFEVTVIDQSQLSNGTSHGNAGMIVPSHFVPLAAPGVIAKGIRWLFDSKSPFYIKPRLNLELMNWVWQFYRSSTSQKASRAMPIIKAFNQWSKELYQEFNQLPAFDCSFEEKGLLLLYQQAKTEKEEMEVAEKAHELGLQPKILSPDELKKLEPNLQLNVRGGVYYPGDAHLYPNQFMQILVEQLKAKGVQFILGNGVANLTVAKGKVNQLILMDGRHLKVSKLVLATGSWTAKLLRQIGVKMLLQDGKGYSITLKNPVKKPNTPTILTEAKVAVTPMGSDLRIGGTLEISNLSPKINKNRLAGILESMPRYYPELQLSTPALEEVWHGFRPCTPDGLPYIGQVKSIDNLTVATGHAMMGMSLGPATGKLVAQLLSNQQTELDISLFQPERFN